MENQEAVELAAHDNVWRPTNDDNPVWEQWQQNYILGQAAVEELALLKPILALAISKLPKQQLKLSLTDQANPSGLDLQMKQESKSGAILFRAVRSGN